MYLSMMFFKKYMEFHSIKLRLKCTDYYYCYYYHYYYYYLLETESVMGIVEHKICIFLRLVTYIFRHTVFSRVTCIT